ncbi:MAG: LamG-like jellyroll fold domain-containing protein, partial [Chitinophagales bacterium]
MSFVSLCLDAQICPPNVSYLFDGDVEDYSGLNNDGTLQAGASVADDYLTIAYNNVDHMIIPGDALDGATDFTMSFDFRITEFNTTGSAPTNTFIAGASGVSEGEFAISYEELDQTLVVAIKNSGTLYDIDLEDQTWYCMKVIREGSLVSVYIDGILIDANNMSSAALDISFLEFGQELDCTTGCFVTNQCLNGDIDNFNIYPCADVNAQCNVVIPPCDTMLLYKFTDNVDDESGNSFHGTIFADADVTANYLSIGYNDDDFVQIPNEAINGLTEFTLSFNFILNDFNTSGSAPTNTFVAGISASNEHEFAFSYEKSSNGFEIAIHDVGGIIPAIINAGQWYCVTFYCSGDSIYAELDGLLLPGSVAVPDAEIEGDFFEIGQELDCVGGCFAENQCLNGAIDNLIITNCTDKINCGQVQNAVNEISGNNTFNVFPNPASDYLYLTSAYTSGYDFTIIDVYGKVVMEVGNSSVIGVQKIDIANLPAGIYFIVRDITINNDICPLII